MRAAIYFTPDANDALTREAAAWLMRDPFAGTVTTPVADPILAATDIVALTAEPRRYGFHATVKAPFRPAEGSQLADLAEALEAYGRSASIRRIDALQLERLGAFFALTPTAPSPAIEALAADVVAAFDRFRAPLTPSELARRRRAPLTPSEERNLVQWGYPYVMADFRFHLTLTGPVPTERQADVAASLGRRFARFIGKPLAIDGLALFVQPDAEADFRVHARYGFAGGKAAP